MKNQNLASSILLTFSLLASTNAAAECKYLQGGLKQKMGEYREYRGHSEKTYLSLLARDAECKKTGASKSTAISAAAEGLSCEAQGNASSLNKQLAAVGESCEQTFAQLNAIQVTLRAAYSTVKADLDSAMDYMEKSKVLKEYCAEEIKISRTMTAAFLKLEAEIIQVETRSLAGKQDYGKFKVAARQLEAVTAAANRNCGNSGSVQVAAVSNTRAVGAAAPAIPSGRSPASSSDISGTKKAIQDEVLASALIDSLGKR